MRTAAAVTSKTFSGKQIWTRGRDARNVVTNTLLPAYNSFLKGNIFPSGWEIEDMLQATVRKLYLDAKSAITLTVDGDDEKSDGEAENEEIEADKSVDSDDRVSDTVIFPKGFPSELQVITIPDDWKPPQWNIFLWFGAPCEFLYDRTVHSQLQLIAGNESSRVVRMDTSYR